ncbi:hypothetical protein BGX30_000253 [Mortierella sp. GBA39]|nr:hypothetical protein BGX30_000253 [Mortierella sp. GBA39]
MAKLGQALPSILRYPDPGHRRLKALLSRKLGVAPEHLSIGNGAAESMALLLLGLAPSRVGIVQPCFSEYRQLSEQFGAEVHAVFGSRERDWRAEVSDIAGMMRKVDLLFLGQPNNPNGVQYPLEEIRELAAEAERTRTYFVVDEAFIDFIPEGRRMTLLPELERFPRTILQVTWSVNGLALLAGELCLEGGEAHERETLELIAAERARLRAGLRDLGCRVSGGEANFLLAELPAPWSAGELQRELGLRGVLIRSCAMYPGLGPGHVRFAVKGADANARLLAVLGDVLASRAE